MEPTELPLPPEIWEATPCGARALILAQRESHWPITKAIYELFSRLGDGPYIASALGVWAMLILTLTILSASALLGRRMGAIFRV